MNHKIVFTCLSVLAFALSANPRAHAQTTTQSLAGSWSITFTPVNAAPTAAAPAVTEGLVTFTTDGSVVETDSSEVSPGVVSGSTGTGDSPTISPAVITARAASYGTAGHGIWQGGAALGTYYVQFTSLFVNPTGSLQSRKVVTMTGTLDSTGSHFTGNFTAQLIDHAGTVLGTSSGKVSADKMVHPSLPAATFE